MWGLLNETLNRNIRKQSTHEFSLNNKTTSDPEVIANEFNQYFANLGSKLAEHIPAAPRFDSYLNNPAETVFSFNLISEHNISNVIKKLKKKSSYGHDCLPNIMIKKAHDPLIKPLTLLINNNNSLLSVRLELPVADTIKLYHVYSVRTIKIFPYEIICFINNKKINKNVLHIRILHRHESHSVIKGFYQ